MSSCIVIPPSSGAPATVSTNANLGWNAGASSITSLSGNLHAQFTVPVAVGVICGLAAVSAPVSVPTYVTHAFLFQQHFGLDSCGIIENGVVVVNPFTRSLASVFEIRRANEHVTYFIDGVLVYTSKRLSTGEVVLVGCLFAAGDTIG